MTAEKLLRLLLDLDQQCISPRPSAFGLAAELVATLCRHAEPSLRRPSLLGDWEAVDLSPARRRPPREIRQPTLDEATGLPLPRMVADASRFLKARERGEAIGPDEAADLACHVLALIDAISPTDPR